MTSPEYNWFIGSKATDRVGLLSKKIKTEYLERANLLSTKRFDAYAPWMACEDHLSGFAVLAEDESYLTKTELKTCTSISLEILSQILFGKGSAFGGLIGPENCRIAASLSEVPQFEEEIRIAIEYIKIYSPILSNLLDTIVDEIVPMTDLSSAQQSRYMGSGLSAHWYIGGILLSLPKGDNLVQRRIELATNLVHELGHQTLIIYQCADKILEDLEEPVFSLIRKTERPGIMSFHALIALTFMKVFLAGALKSKQTEEERQYCQTKLTEVSRDLNTGLILIQKLQFTAFGNSLLNEVRAIASA